MEEKRSGGRGGRNEGYRGASGSGGAKAGGFRGGRPGADRFSKGAGDFGKPTGSRAGRSSTDQSSAERYSKPSSDRYGKSTNDRYSKSNTSHFGKPDTEGFSKPGTDHFRKSSTGRPGKSGADRFGGSNTGRSNIDRPNTDRRGTKYGAPYGAPKDDTALEQNNAATEDFAASQGDLDKLEGRNSVLEALKSGRSINRIFVAKGEREGSVNQIIAMARQSHILIQEIERAKLDAMSVTHAHQGVIALTAAKDYVEVDEILESAAASGRPPFLIILDEITDSHNLGSILRTANAAGVHGVIIPKRRAVGLTSVVSKASAGAIEYVPVARVTNIVQTIEMLKKQNIWVVGTDSTGDAAYFDRDLTGPVALVIGSEGEGMGKLVRESCDFVVNIPMLGQITSLNAAVAGAIVTYEIVRQRSKKKP
jgi:23S rRNA (guanosine2251-2'-O)-methyltransferase